MHLTLTPELISELYEGAITYRRQFTNTGIALTFNGWEVLTWADRCAWPVVMTAQDVENYCDGMFDADMAAGLAAEAPPERGSYAIPDEDGDDVRAPACGEAPAVVTFTQWMDFDADTGAYRFDVEADVPGAWWFDVSRSRQLITADQHELRSPGTTQELWVTNNGRYIARTWTRRMDSPDGAWSAMDAEQAIHTIYDADPDRVVDDLPPTLDAAWHMARAAELITPPSLSRDFEPTVVDAHARRHEDHAAEVFAAARALGDLARTRFAMDMRHRRAAAGRVVARAEGSTTAAAQRLGIARPTLSNIIG